MARRGLAQARPGKAAFLSICSISLSHQPLMRQKNPAPNFLGMTGGEDRTSCVALVKLPAN